MLGFELIHVSKRGPCCEKPQHWVSDMKTHMVSITVAPFLLLFFLDVTQASTGPLITMMVPTLWEWDRQKNVRVVVADKLVQNEYQNICQLDFWQKPMWHINLCNWHITDIKHLMCSRCCEHKQKYRVDCLTISGDQTSHKNIPFPSRCCVCHCDSDRCMSFLNYCWCMKSACITMTS